MLGERVTLSNPLDYHTYVWGDLDAMTAAFTAMLRGPADLHLLFADLPRADRCADGDWRSAITAFHRACACTGARGALVAAMAGNLAGPRAAEWVRRGLPMLAPPAVAMEAVEAAAAIGQAWAASARRIRWSGHDRVDRGPRTPGCSTRPPARTCCGWPAYRCRPGGCAPARTPRWPPRPGCPARSW